MTKPNDPAFPVSHIRLGEGLSKKEYFSVLAMQALIQRETMPADFQITIDNAVKFADLLIAELDKNVEKSEKQRFMEDSMNRYPV